MKPRRARGTGSGTARRLVPSDVRPKGSRRHRRHARRYLVRDADAQGRRRMGPSQGHAGRGCVRRAEMPLTQSGEIETPRRPDVHRPPPSGSIPTEAPARTTLTRPFRTNRPAFRFIYGHRAASPGEACQGAEDGACGVRWALGAWAKPALADSTASHDAFHIRHGSSAGSRGREFVRQLEATYVFFCWVLLP